MLFARRNRLELSLMVTGCGSCDPHDAWLCVKTGITKHCCGSDRNLLRRVNWWSQSSVSPLDKGVLIRSSEDGSSALCGLLTRRTLR